MDVNGLLFELKGRLPAANVVVRRPLSAHERASRREALAVYNAFWRGRLLAKDEWYAQRYWG